MSQQRSEHQPIQVPRWKVGLIALGCFVGAGIARVGWPQHEMIFASLIRVGLLMFAFWIAMPSGDRPAAWASISRTTVVWFAALVMAAIRPSFARFLIPLVMMITSINYFLKPKAKERPRADR